MAHLMAHLITDLGDAALLLPAGAAVLLYLLLSRSRPAAFAWASVLMLSVGLTVLAKVVFHACGDRFTDLDIHSPSGHTSLSTTFYLCGALLITGNRDRVARLPVLGAAAALVLAIAASRVVVHAHTGPEVAAGLIIGLLCVALFAVSCRARAVASIAWPLPLAVLLMFALLAHGHHLTIESLIFRLTDRVHVAQHVCPLSDTAAEDGPSLSPRRS